MDKYREYLPQSWLEFIDRDPVLAAAFSAHEYACDSEPVAPFLFQDLRGGEMERLRPIFALYGHHSRRPNRLCRLLFHPPGGRLPGSPRGGKGLYPCGKPDF